MDEKKDQFGALKPEEIVRRNHYTIADYCYILINHVLCQVAYNVLQLCTHEKQELAESNQYILKNEFLFKRLFIFFFGENKR